MSLSNKLAIIDLDLKDKRVLIRVCDFVGQSFGHKRLLIYARSTSMSQSMLTSLITPALLVRFPPSSTPSTMELKP